MSLKSLSGRFGNFRIAAVAALLAVGAAKSSLAAPATIQYLGNLPGGSMSLPWSVNAAGEVVGESDFDPFNTAFHGFLSTGSPRTMYDVGTLGGARSVARDINALSQIVGTAALSSNLDRAFLYTGIPGSGGSMANLGTLGGTYSRAYGINDSGGIAGETQMPSGFAHAFLYTGTPGSGGAMEDLGTLGGFTSSAYAISPSGKITGSAATTGNAATHAFRYTGTPGSGGAMVSLGTLAGGVAQGRAINDDGLVAGYSKITVNGADHAFLYTGTPGVDGVMHDLGTLGGANSFAHGINVFGQVVGWSERASGPPHAILYTGTPGVNGQMIDLDAWFDTNNPTEGAKWLLFEAYDITDTGLITGRGSYFDGTTSFTGAYLLDAGALVPEPGSLALLLAGLGLLGLRGRSSNRKS